MVMEGWVEPQGAPVFKLYPEAEVQLQSWPVVELYPKAEVQPAG
jgi:hypothetical protein